MSTRTLMMMVLGICLAAGPAMALDITIFDEDVWGSGSWFDGSLDKRPGIREDNEVEPGNDGGPPNIATGQVWDLEGMWIQGTKLTLVGGWNFGWGYTYNNQHIKSGDLFIDNSKPNNGAYGTGTNAWDGTTPNYGYDYAFDIDWEGLGTQPNWTNTTSVLVNWGFQVLDQANMVSSVVSEDVNRPESNPYRFTGTINENRPTGQAVLRKFDSAAALSSFFGVGAESMAGLLGGYHYTVTFDLAPVLTILGWDEDSIKDKVNPNLLFHFTQSCGNDNLMGFVPNSYDPVPVVPEPATMTLLGLGIAGMITLQMRRKATRA